MTPKCLIAVLKRDTTDLSFDIHAAASPGRMEKHRTAKQFEKLPVHVLQASAPNATFRKVC